MYTSVKATALSIRPKRWDKPGNADKLEAYVREAAADGPELVVAPEGFLEGSVINEVIAQPDRAYEMLDLAEPIDGPYIQRFRRLSKALGICLCFGFAERIGHEVYNCAIFVDTDGEIRGKYHKTQFAEGTHAEWFFNRIGKTIRAFDTPFGKAGFLICNDRWNPMIARTLVLDGAQLLLIPSMGSTTRDQNQNVLARARENGVPIVEANVGNNLIISKGEIVAYKWGVDKITTAVIDVPAAPSEFAARKSEMQYLEYQGPEMERRYRRTMERLKG